MLSWRPFTLAAPAIADAGIRLLEKNEVAFLATVSRTGRPRIHPFVPKIVDGRLLAFIMDSSPKFRDLRDNGNYSMHTLPGAEDEEFFISGKAQEIDPADELRAQAITAMGFVTTVDEHEVLFELFIDRALTTRWLNFGTADHRPERAMWTTHSLGFLETT